MEVSTTSLKPTPIPADDSDVYETNAVESNESKANMKVHVISEVESGDGLDQTSIQKTSIADVQKLALDQPSVDTTPPEAAEVDAAVPPTTPKLLVPSLKGKMTYQGGAVACKGQWGMSDDAHDQPGQTSDFEFNLVEAESSDSKRLFPMDGKYEGWFYMKQVPPAKGVKVEDKEMMIKFLEQDASDEANASVGGNQKNYRIEGSGWNKFGKFNLRGSLSEHGDLHIYREYYFLTPAPVGRRKSVGQTPRAGSISRRGSFSAPGLSTDSADAAAAAGPQDTSPRESGRIRKQSSVMQEYTESKTPRSSVGSSSGFGASKQNSKHAEKQPMQRQESTGSTAERTQRLTGPLKKCHDLVRELSKHPQGLWFLEPVDYVAMNLPQYPKIIKNPMDFATVRSKIEAGKYEGAEDFAEDMRLIFRNAMEFNFQTDSPVHIAAREMLNRFEDRMRILNTQLGGINTYSAAVATSMTDGPPSKMARTSSTASVSSGGRGGAKRGGKAGRGAMSRSSSVSFGFVAPAAGPRPGFAAPPVPVLGTGSSSDASAHTIAEMQRMMQAMQEEINSLRAMVKQQEIVERLSESQAAAQNPLSIQEKKELIQQIHMLPPHKLESVITIIQASLGGKPITDEIPLDTLDTLTMRKLQKFIEENNEKKRRSSKSSGVKRPRKPKTEADAAGGASATDGGNLPGDSSFFGAEDEELLFPMESLEGAAAQGDEEFDADHPVTMDDEDDFAALASPGRK